MIFPRVYRSVSRDRQRFGCFSVWLMFRWLPALLMLLLTMLLLSATTARAQQSPAQDIGAGQLLLTDGQGNVRSAMTQRSRVNMDITGMIAVVHLQQVFSNDTEHWMEGVYAFPLPDNGAVRHMELQLGERRIVGKIAEKEAAKAAYVQASKAGKKASLVEQHRPNMFTTRVANVAPGEQVTVELEYVQTVDYSGGRFGLRLPTTITPRYMPGMPIVEAASHSLHRLPAHGWAQSTDQVPDAADISPLQHAIPGADSRPRNPLEITVRLDAGMPLAGVDSPYHQVVLSREEDIYTLRLAAKEAEMDRDFVLNWTPVTGSAPAAALFTEHVDSELYGLLMVVPPVLEKSPAAPPREIVFVVDTSGSMGGVSIRQARESLLMSLQFLRPQDSFNIIAFNSDYSTLFTRANPASAKHLQRAREFIRRLDASGGTEMLPALRAALQRSVESDELSPHALLRQVVFITDGAVGNEEALFEEIRNGLGSSRLFTVGIGSAPNSWFMRKAADYGRGSFTYIADVAEVNARMSALFSGLAAPVVLDLAVDWPAGVEVWPQQVPDLYLGEPLVLAVKFGELVPSKPITVSGRIGNKDWETTLQWPKAAADAASLESGVASLWAREKIEQLMGERHHVDDADALRAKVLPVALRHQLLSPYTSFVAVEEKIARPPGSELHSAPLPNSRPQGQSAQPYAYPQTATTARAKIWIACLFMLIGLLVHVCRQEGESA